MEPTHQNFINPCNVDLVFCGIAAHYQEKGQIRMTFPAPMEIRRYKSNKTTGDNKKELDVFSQGLHRLRRCSLK